MRTLYFLLAGVSLTSGGIYTGRARDESQFDTSFERNMDCANEDVSL